MNSYPYRYPRLRILLALVLVVILLSSCFQGNTAPVIEGIEIDKNTVRVSDTLGVHCLAFDSDADVLFYDWHVSGGGICGNGPSIIWQAPDTPGTYAVSVIVGDHKDRTVTARTNIRVLANQLPVIKSLRAIANYLPQRPVVLPNEVLILECVASDPDGDRLEYRWTTTGGTIYSEGKTAIWVAPDYLDSFTIGVTVTDGYGTSVSKDLHASTSVEQPGPGSP